MSHRRQWRPQAMAHAFPTCTSRRSAAQQTSGQRPGQRRSSSAPEAAGMAPAVRSWIKCSCNGEPLAEATVLELARRVQLWKTHSEGPEQAPPRVKRQGLRARNQLVAHNLRLIGSTWTRHRSGLPGLEEQERLEAEALERMQAAAREHGLL